MFFLGLRARGWGTFERQRAHSVCGLWGGLEEVAGGSFGRMWTVAQCRAVLARFLFLSAERHQKCHVRFYATEATYQNQN